MHRPPHNAADAADDADADLHAFLARFDLADFLRPYVAEVDATRPVGDAVGDVVAAYFGGVGSIMP